ncbi:MAG: LAGLIDADG family homing endonuclease, partial [Thaumarchaeota archaeon]|nr:LAGLIDADG family homing endonuclease [Nitrososphaerota archaeon]
RRYLRGERSMPLEIFRQIARFPNANFAELQGRIMTRAGKNGNRLSVGPGLLVDEEFVYISELIRCDGHLPRSLQYAVFVNKENVLIARVKDFLERLGLKKDSMSVSKQKDVYFLRIHSRLFTLILHTVFGIPSGKKADMKVRQFVLGSAPLAAAMVRAAFDAEGSVSGVSADGTPGSRRITISSISKGYLKCVQGALGSFSISSRIYFEDRMPRGIYRLVIYHQDNLRKFADIIKPFHPKRSAKLARILETYHKERIPELSLRIKILRSIELGNTTRRQIALSLGLSHSRVGNQLYKLRKRKLLAKPTLIWTNHGWYGVYRLTAKGRCALGLLTEVAQSRF